MSIYVRALASGSSGNALLVRAGDVALLVDAGLPGRRLAALLRYHNVRPGVLAGILVSHEHTDHISGAAPLARLYRAPIVANHATLAQIDVSPRVATSTLPTGATRRFGHLEVSTFPVPHDARDPVGFALSYEGWRMCIATDVGYDCRDLEPYIAAADLVVLEANHDVETLRAGSYPWPLKQRILGNGGHLSNDQSGRLLERAFARSSKRQRWVWLAHLSAENNTPRKAHEQIALRLDLAGFLPHVELSVARRDVPSAEWHHGLLARQLALF
jgi:phosphoribosyl 1,2-cyclic phosphodiesterase